MRFDTVQQLFYDGIVEPDAWSLKVSGTLEVEVKADYTNDRYEFRAEPERKMFVLGQQGVVQHGVWMPELARIRFYRIKDFVEMANKQLGGLLPPDGRNLVAQLYSSRELR